MSLGENNVNQTKPKSDSSVKSTKNIERCRAKRIDENRTDFFTLTERAFIDLLKKHKHVTEVTHELDISYQRGEQILSNIRNKWEKSTNTHNRLVALCKGDQAFRKLLSKPAPVTPETTDEEQEVREEPKWKH